MTPCRFFTPDEYRTQEDARHAAVKAWRTANPQPEDAPSWPEELKALNASFFPPGSMWFCPWYHDPSKPEAVAKVDDLIARMKAEPDKHWHLSIHYLQDWARIRPPIMVVCPGGGHWCPDQGSSNGTGWTVTGEVPNITASPSIWVSQGEGAPREYHGWLQNGAFSGPV